MKYLFIASFLLSTVFSYAQEKDLKTFSYPRYAIGYTPSAHLNIFPAHQISQDIRLAENINITLETGYIYHSLNTRFTRGYRLKGGVEFLLMSRETSGLFVGMSYIRRYTNEPLDLRVFFLEMTASQLVLYNRINVVVGGEVSVGYIKSFSDRLKLEIGFNAGGGYVTYNDIERIIAENEGETIVIQDRNIRNSITNDLLILGSLNLNFSYALFK